MTRAAQRTALRIPHAGLAPLFVIILSVLLPRPAAASTTVFTAAGTACTSSAPCFDLSTFGLLSGAGDTVTLTGSTIKDSIGIVTGGKLSVSGTNTLSSGNIIDFADTVAPNSSCTTGKNLCGTGTVNGFSNGTNSTTIPYSSNSPNLNTSTSAAWTQFNNIYNWLNGTVSGYTTTTISNSTTVLGAESGSATLVNGTYISVYSPTGTNAWSPTSNVTIGCGAGGTSACAHGPNDLVVVLLNSTSTNTFGGKNIAINASSGLTSDQVVFLVKGTITDNANNATTLLSGVYFFGPNAVITAGTGNKQTVSFDGRLFGGAETLTNTTEKDEGAVPEPGTWATLLGGLGAMLGARSYRRRKAKK